MANLVDLLIRCVDHPAAVGQTFLAADGEDLSTAELLRRLAAAMGRPARLVLVPPALLRLGGRLTGRAAEVERLIGSLQVDIRHTRETLISRFARNDKLPSVEMTTWPPLSG